MAHRKQAAAGPRGRFDMRTSRFVQTNRGFVVDFDTATPQLISDFARGAL
jgi:hypothetical protein